MLHAHSPSASPRGVVAALGTGCRPRLGCTNGHGFDSPHNGTVFVLFHFSVLCHFSVFIVKPGNARSICYSNNEVFMLPAPSQSAARVVSVSRSVQSAAVVASLTLSVKLLSSKSVTSVLARPDLAVLLDVSCPQAVTPPPPPPPWGTGKKRLKKTLGLSSPVGGRNMDITVSIAPVGQHQV